MSKSNYNSHGNNRSCGNNWSNGNNESHGNNLSDGNNESHFLHNCRGTHKSIFCYDKQGIAYMILNQQADEEKYNDFKSLLLDILDGFLPYTTTYLEREEDGWHTEYNEKNKYVEERVKDDGKPYPNQYHEAWSNLDQDKVSAIYDLIKNTDWLDTEPAIECFERITGLEAQPDEYAYDKDGYIIGKIVDGRVIQ